MFKITVEGATLDELKANLAAAVALMGGSARAATAAAAAPKAGAAKNATPKAGAAKNATPEPEPDADEDDGSKGIEPQAVSEAVVGLSRAKGRDVAVNLLKTFKTADNKPATKAAEIQPKDYPKAMADIKALMEADDDIS